MPIFANHKAWKIPFEAVYSITVLGQIYWDYVNPRQSKGTQRKDKYADEMSFP